MTRDDFDALVGRIQRRFGSRPLALRARVGLMVALGYAGFLSWFFLVFLVGAAFFLGSVAVDTAPGLVLLVLGSLLLTLGALQAVGLLWVRLEPQPGRDIRAEQSPQLFDVLERLRKELRSARLHRVVLTADFNAGVQQLPRLGVFGWPRNILYLGLSLLEAVSPQEFEAVLAHECAHLSARHGRFGAWICRLRRTWERVFQRLHEPARSSTGRTARRVLLKFVDWYWPRFNAYAFVLSRADEYAADRFAGQWAGAEHAASALWRIECLGRRLRDEFWPALFQLANAQPEPPANLMARLAAVWADPPKVADAERWRQEAIRTLTDNLDTHPSLSDRVGALGCPTGLCQTAFPEPSRPSAAAVWFGQRLAAIRDDVGLLWQSQVRETWRNRHGRACSLERQLAALNQAPGDPEADPDLLWDKARAVLDLEGPEAAEPLLRRLLALRPTHSAANFILGQHLVERRQPEGECFLDRILQSDEDELIPQACEALSRYFLAAGLTDRLQEVRRRLSKFQAAVAAADHERNLVKASDRFLPHGLTSEETAALLDVLAQQTDLAFAWLVRKELKHFSARRLFVLCVRSTAGRWDWSRADRDAALVNRLVPLVRLPGRVLIISPHGAFRALGRKVIAAPGALAYPADQETPDPRVPRGARGSALD